MAYPVINEVGSTQFEPSVAPAVNTYRASVSLAGASNRHQVERYIAEKYRKVHDAELHEFLPILVSITQNDSMLGAFGLRPGRVRPMFLEQYLDSPIEQQAAAISHSPVDRCVLIEVGNLAVTRDGYAPSMFVVLAMSLAEAGFEWMVFTVTHHVERMMLRLGFKPQYLVSADPDRLVKSKASWGTYYEKNPKVMIGELGLAVDVINRNPKLQAIVEQHRKQIRSIACLLSDYRRLGGE